MCLYICVCALVFVCMFVSIYVCACLFVHMCVCVLESYLTSGLGIYVLSSGILYYPGPVTHLLILSELDAGFAVSALPTLWYKWFSPFPEVVSSPDCQLCGLSGSQLSAEPMDFPPNHNHNPRCVLASSGTGVQVVHSLPAQLYTPLPLSLNQALCRRYLPKSSIFLGLRSPGCLRLTNVKRTGLHGGVSLLITAEKQDQIP